MYLIVSRDFGSKRFVVLEETENFLEATNLIEVYGLLYVKEKMGNSNSEIYNESKSGKYGLVPYGYFACKHPQFPKITIYEKILKRGYIYNTTEIRTVISFEIAEKKIQKVEEEELDFEEIEENLMRKKNSWKQLHEQLISIDKFKSEAKN